MLRSWLVCLGILWSTAAFSALDLPEKPKAYVNDYANVLTTTAAKGLEQRFAEFERQTKHQAVVAIFSTIEGEAIDDLANRLFEKWGVGSKERNDGILLVLAMQEREVRIEVGYGLEARLPDALAGRIIRTDMYPFLRQGQVATAILAFEKRLGEIFVEGRAPVINEVRQKPRIPGLLVFVLLIAMIVFGKLAAAGGYTHTIGPAESTVGVVALESGGAEAALEAAEALVDSAVEGEAFPEEEVPVAGGEFLSAAEEARLVDTIRAMERRTSGEIRVHITRRVSRKGVMFDAAKTFVRLGMDKTAQRNGVLLYIAVKDHELACIGDEGIHKFIGADGWNAIVDDLKAHFKKGDFYLGLQKALSAIGTTLETHFPGNGARNELPDEISRD